MLNMPEEVFDQSIALAIDQSDCEVLFDRLEKVYLIYMQMLHNLQKYSVLYSDLREHLLKLQNAIDFFCSGRSQERLELEKRLRSNNFSVSTFYSRTTDSTSFSFLSLISCILYLNLFF